MSILGSLLGGGSNRPEPSETMQSNAGGLMSKFNPFNLVSGMFGRKKSAVDNYANTKGGMRKGLKESKKKDPKFVSKTPRSDMPVQRGDSVTDIAAKLYGLIKRNDEKKKKELQIEENFAKSFNDVKEKRNQQLIAALTTQPVGLKKETKNLKKDSDKVKKETKGVKKETPKGKEPTKEAPKPSVQPPVSAPKGPAPATAPKGPTPAGAKPPTATPAPAAPSAAPSTIPGAAAPTAIKLGIGAAGVVGMVNAQADELGVTNEYTKKAILANIGKETNFKSTSEDLSAYAKTSNARIREIFPTSSSTYTDQQLNEIKKDPYKFAEAMYGKNTKMGRSMGHTEEGDGFKYIGRGFIQVTGKNNYKELGKKLGIDLVSNPEKLNDPQIAAKAAIIFVRDGLGNKVNSFKNQSEANRAVTQTIGGKRLNLDKGYGAKLLSKVEEYSKSIGTTGAKLSETSVENKDLKKQAAAASSSPIVVNNNNNIVASNAPTQTMVQPKSDASRFIQGAKV